MDPIGYIQHTKPRGPLGHCCYCGTKFHNFHNFPCLKSFVALWLGAKNFPSPCLGPLFEPVGFVPWTHDWGRIIPPVGNMVNVYKSPKDRVVAGPLLKWPKFMAAYKSGLLFLPNSWKLHLHPPGKTWQVEFLVGSDSQIIRSILSSDNKSGNWSVDRQIFPTKNPLAVSSWFS